MKRRCGVTLLELIVASRSMTPRRGVTLMELIVALTVTGLMAAVGTTTFGSIIDSRRIVRESTTATERSAALRESLRGWLLPASVQIQTGGVPRGRGASNVRGGTTSATTHTQNGAQGVTAAVANGDELVFTTTAPNPANAPNARMRLFIDTDEATPETGLTLEYQVNLQMPLQRRQLDSTVQTMTVEYLDRATGRWYAVADAAAIRPKALKLTLQAAEGHSLPPLTALPMLFYLSSFALTTGSTATPLR